MSRKQPTAPTGTSPVLIGVIVVGVLAVAVLAMLLLTLNDTKETPAPASLEPLAQEGKTLFLDSGCNRCHPSEGRKGGVGPRLSSTNLGDQNIRDTIRNGRGAMPGTNVLTDDDITKILTYIKAIKASAG